MLTLGEGGIYMLFTLTLESHKITGLAKMSMVLGSEGHSDPKETLHDSSLPSCTTRA